MKKFLAASAALLATTSLATAGGLDRSGQGIGAIFESGKYAELSFGYVMPNVSGVLGVSSGDVAPDYFSLGFAYKQDLNDKLSIAVIFDQPFGAAIDYTVVPAYPLPDVTAELRSTGFTALGRYKLSDRVSVHGGVRLVTMSGTITGAAPVPFEYAPSSDVGYVIGGAYEIPEIALRAALTYSSATNHANTASAGPNIPAYTMPQSVNLDFQTGIAANTLLMASIRWADWTETALNTPIGLIDYTEDTFTYSLGVGRRFNDNFAGSISLGYERAQGGLASNLSPTDGYFSIQVGGAYTMDNGMEISGGVRYVFVGDATTETVNAQFTDNSAIGVGIKVGYNF